MTANRRTRSADWHQLHSAVKDCHQSIVPLGSYRYNEEKERDEQLFRCNHCGEEKWLDAMNVFYFNQYSCGCLQHVDKIRRRQSWQCQKYGLIFTSTSEAASYLGCSHHALRRAWLQGKSSYTFKDATLTHLGPTPPEIKLRRSKRSVPMWKRQKRSPLTSSLS
jgi:hypothetical protein